MTVQSFNYSYNSIQSFKYSVSHPTILKPRGHQALFRCDSNNLLKTCFCCCPARKLPHVWKFYFGNFYRAFIRLNNYVATILLPVILMSFKLWSCWGIHKQFGVFYRVKAFLHSSSWQIYYKSALLLFRTSFFIGDSGTELPADKQSNKDLRLKINRIKIIDLESFLRFW